MSEKIVRHLYAVILKSGTTIYMMLSENDVENLRINKFENIKFSEKQGDVGLVGILKDFDAIVPIECTFSYAT